MPDENILLCCTPITHKLLVDTITTFEAKGKRYEILMSDDNQNLKALYLGRADLVLFDEQLIDLVAIELKINKWKAALRQAMVHQLWATEAYVALSRKHINSALRNWEIFEKCGVGLISVDGFSKIEISAKKSVYQKPQYLEMAKREIKIRFFGEK